MGIGHNIFMPRQAATLIIFLLFSIAISGFADQTTNSTNVTEAQSEARKSYLEDIFIWKMSDELKLTAKEEKAFAEILKKLNKEKSELNRKIQAKTESLNEKSTPEEVRQLKKLLLEYNRYGTREFESVQALLGHQKFVQYLKIKNELSTKMKSILIGDKSGEKKEGINSKSLPKPKVTVEKQD